jgi:hypothetical protein
VKYRWESLETEGKIEESKRLSHFTCQFALAICTLFADAAAVGVRSNEKTISQVTSRSTVVERRKENIEKIIFLLFQKRCKKIHLDWRNGRKGMDVKT